MKFKFFKTPNTYSDYSFWRSEHQRYALFVIVISLISLFCSGTIFGQPDLNSVLELKSQTENKLGNLKKQYKENHPEVIAAQVQLAAINDEINTLAMDSSNPELFFQYVEALANLKKTEIALRQLRVSKTDEHSDVQEKLELIISLKAKIRQYQLQLIQPARLRRTIWEYKFEQGCTEKKANELGAQGWELVSIQSPGAGFVVGVYVFKRAK